AEPAHLAIGIDELEPAVDEAPGVAVAEALGAILAAGERDELSSAGEADQLELVARIVGRHAEPQRAPDAGLRQRPADAERSVAEAAVVAEPQQRRQPTGRSRQLDGDHVLHLAGVAT